MDWGKSSTGMHREKIEYTVHLYFLRLGKHYRAIRKNVTAETIKPFRIEIKKLRAFLRLLEMVIRHPARLELNGPLKKMHKSGGRFRDLQLHRQRVKEAMTGTIKVNYDKRLLQDIDRAIRKEKKEFLSHDRFNDTEKELKKHLPDDYRVGDIKEFFRGQLQVIADIIAEAKYRDKQMHTIRKRLKDILYIIKLYSLDLRQPLGFRFWNKVRLQHAKETEDLLGFLNDSNNALKLISPGLVNQYGPAEKRMFLLIRRKLLAEKRKLKEQAITAVSKLVLTV